MPEIITLRRRLSHRYSLGWSHLDRWSDKETRVKALEPRNEATEDCIEQTTRWTRKFTFPRNANHKQLAQAIADMATRSSCTHEWDCCGCWSTRAYVLSSNPRSATLRFSASRNY